MPFFLRAIDAIVSVIGNGVAWLLVPMVIGQFALVLLRYVFGIGTIMGQEAVIFGHGTIFMVIAGLVMQRDEHVRVDIWYTRLGQRGRAKVDTFGLAVFVLPLCALILIVGWPYVASSWAILEGSRETSGLPLVFVHKTMVLVFAALLALQALAELIRKLSVLLGFAEER